MVGVKGMGSPEEHAIALDKEFWSSLPIPLPRAIQATFFFRLDTLEVGEQLDWLKDWENERTKRRDPYVYDLRPRVRRDCVNVPWSGGLKV
jgi:hypothetical protein